MSLESLIASWKEVRAGLIDEMESVPAEKFAFQAAPDTRSIAGVLQHIVQSQKMLIGEVCRPDTNLLRQSFVDQIKTYAPGVSEIEDKQSLIDLLRTTMEESETSLRAAARELQNDMNRFDGQQMAKLDFLGFAIAHEMYHRGQLTVYERLLGIEPVLTKRFRKVFGDPNKASA
ncbi:MAG: DinB family protein [Pyrinomonadaceae bacterium]